MTAFDPFGVGSRLADCICPLLKAPRDPAHPEIPGWEGDCCIKPGAVPAWDNCCSDQGQMTINILNGYPTRAFPAQDSSLVPGACGTPTQAVGFEITVLRCVCATGNCDCETDEQKAADLLADLKAILQGISCCFASDVDCDGWVVTGWATRGPEGACAGVTVNLLVEMDNPCCPETN